MGDNRLARVMAAAAVGLACLMAAPASAQSITDRFKSLFGGKSDEEPATTAPGSAVPQDTGDLTCPPVTVRAGASTYAVAAPGKQPVGNDLRFQATISKMARGVSEKTIATKAYQTTVNMTEGGSEPFTLVAEDLTYPAPPGAVGDSYIFYIGFDPQALKPERPAPKKKKQ
jgi:hypothetical protein